jgi:hypothetical protein
MSKNQRPLPIENALYNPTVRVGAASASATWTF